MIILLILLSAGVWLSAGYYLGSRYENIMRILKELRERTEPKTAEIVMASPRKIPPQRQPNDEGSFVVTTKSPRQLEKEAKEEVDRIGGLL